MVVSLSVARNTFYQLEFGAVNLRSSIELTSGVLYMSLENAIQPENSEDQGLLYTHGGIPPEGWLTLRRS